MVRMMPFGTVDNIRSLGLLYPFLSPMVPLEPTERMDAGGPWGGWGMGLRGEGAPGAVVLWFLVPPPTPVKYHNYHPPPIPIIPHLPFSPIPLRPKELL